MSQERPASSSLDAMLPVLRARVIARLPGRAFALEEAANRIAGGDADACDALREHAHKLAGIAGTYGLDALGEDARSLELDVLRGVPHEHLVAVARRLAARCRAIAESEPSLEVPPTEPSPPPSPPPSATRAVEGTLRSSAPQVILVIDDDDATARLLDLALVRLGGFAVTVVSSAERGYASLEGQRFDLVLCDAMMPDTNGLAFVAKVRRSMPHLRDMPIIILSAASAEELGASEATHPPDGWLRKPVRPQALVTDLRRFLPRAAT